jgi:hypothetical protein
VALSVTELIREARDALMRADALRLESLALQVPALSGPAGACEWGTAMAEQRAFERLLSLTRHNLRLLGRDPARPGPYGPRRN